MSEQDRFYNANDFNSSPLNMNIDPDAESTPLQLEMNLANLDPALRAPVATRHRYYQAVLNILEESRTLNPENYFTFAPQMQELSRLAHEFDVWQCEITRLNLNVEEADAEADTANIQRNFDRAMKLARLPYLKLSEENRRQNETKSQQDQQTLLSSISTAVAPPTQKSTPSAAKILVTSSEATPGSQKAKPKNSSNSKKNKNSSNQTSEQSQSCQCCVSTKPSTDASPSHQNSPRINPASGRAYYCQWCEENHPLVQCDKIKSLTVAQRRTQVKAESRCWNCLSVKHHSRLCPSTKRCLHHPTEKHNTLLCEHVPAGTSPAPAVAQTVPATAPSVNAAVSSFSRHSGADPTICVAKSPPTPISINQFFVLYAQTA
ncbi:unnamed protein product [Bemisia tabaci]|uniref:Uncharacterized protein n=1 Tax=Bemisia tabaci TaxID=7038 RepID=A0A9P0G3I3_BEMTA|nr:unnamed protein product [Bemisia tabaci]